LGDPRDPRRERLRVAVAFAVAVLPPLVLLAYLAVRAAGKDREALLDVEVKRTQEIARSARDSVALAVRDAEEACFPRDLGPLRSRDPRLRAELERSLEAIRREHPIAVRFLAFDEDGRVLLPDRRLPWRLEPVPPEDGDEDRATDAPTLQRRRAARVSYEKAVELEARGTLAEAAALLLTIADDPDASPVLRARAAFRRGAILETLRDPENAIAAYSRAAASPVAARDEHGLPLRTRASLRQAALLRDRSNWQEAFLRARDLGQALLAGEHRDLSADEWNEALRGARDELDAIARACEGVAETGPIEDRPSTGSRLLVASEAELRASLAWVARLEGELGAPLRTALQKERADELLNNFSLRAPATLLAYRVLSPLAVEPGELGSLRTKRLIFGFEVDLDRLARDVIGPACAEESLRHEPPLGLAALDVHGLVRAYAGGGAAPDAQGKPLPTDAVVATAPLEPPPLWQLRVLRSSELLERESSRRTILFLGLFGLALVATAAGGAATFRSVARSLELARMKQDFVSNVTHELKTPLTSIRMYAESLSLGRYRDEEKKKEYLDTIIRESERLARLIDDVLDFARVGEGKRPYVLAEGDVTEVVLEAIELFRHSAKVRGFELYLDLPALGGLPPVDLDRDALVRSVLNLLSNAVKYSPDSRYVGVSVKREGDLLAISVADKGIGIDKEDLDRIFDRFYRAGDVLTRAVSGAGLGLSLVDEVVRSHGGKIRVESARGKGSTFIILLPIVKDYRNVPWPPPGSEEAPIPPSSDEAVVPGATAAPEAKTEGGSPA
jgi:signal transduction histidine kinase